MTQIDKTCEDCGRAFSAIRKNTAYCRVCRLLRNSLYYQDTLQECLLCERKYAPLEKKKIAVCMACNPNKRFDLAAGSCAFCDQDSKELLHADVHVCTRCGEDPEQRELLVRALGKKQQALKAAS